jgi:hypothetical protein
VHSVIALNARLHAGTEAWMAQYDHASYRLKLLVHEMSHAWQMAALGAQRPDSDVRTLIGPPWADEGTADLLAFEQVRRLLGVAPRSNWDWTRHLRATDPKITLAFEPAWQTGELASGYVHAASFLRHLQARLMEAGVDGDIALSEITRGALEGWHGREIPDGRGLAERISVLLGGPWDPEEAALDWALSQGADDRGVTGAYRNPWYRDATSGPASNGWRSVGGTDATDLDRALEHRSEHPAGSAAYFHLGSRRGDVKVSAESSAPGARWVLFRVR